MDATFTDANDENEPKNAYVNFGKKNAMPDCNIPNDRKRFNERWTFPKFKFQYCQ